jgi:nucleoside phosphorylase
MTDERKRLKCEDYHVAWICPVADLELVPARLMLDEEHETPQYDTHFDDNTYVLGSIKGHTVVIGTLPAGETANVNAARLSGSLFKTFPNIRMVLLVGIGGGIPSATSSTDALENIHLGDVVVGWPGDGKPACVYHSRGRSKTGGFEIVGMVQNPDWRLTNALGVLKTDYEMEMTTFNDQLARLQSRPKLKKRYAHPGFEHDKLFKTAYRHKGEEKSGCTDCQPSELVRRPERTEQDQDTFVIHFGRIASGDSVIKDAVLRDEIRSRCDGALCVEMEAAGVDANRRCLVIRGISDYADSHKCDMWRSYAAGKAAAFARELLCKVQPGMVREMSSQTQTQEAQPG